MARRFDSDGVARPRREAWVLFPPTFCRRFHLLVLLLVSVSAVPLGTSQDAVISGERPPSFLRDELDFSPHSLSSPLSHSSHYPLHSPHSPYSSSAPLPPQSSHSSPHPPSAFSPHARSFLSPADEGRGQGEVLEEARTHTRAQPDEVAGRLRPTVYPEYCLKCGESLINRRAVPPLSDESQRLPLLLVQVHAVVRHGSRSPYAGDCWRWAKRSSGEETGFSGTGDPRKPRDTTDSDNSSSSPVLFPFLLRRNGPNKPGGEAGEGAARRDSRSEASLAGGPAKDREDRVIEEDDTEEEDTEEDDTEEEDTEEEDTEEGQGSTERDEQERDDEDEQEGDSLEVSAYREGVSLLLHPPSILQAATTVLSGFASERGAPASLEGSYASLSGTRTALEDTREPLGYLFFPLSSFGSCVASLVTSMASLFSSVASFFSSVASVVPWCFVASRMSHESPRPSASPSTNAAEKGKKTQRTERRRRRRGNRHHGDARWTRSRTRPWNCLFEEGGFFLSKTGDASPTFVRHFDIKPRKSSLGGSCQPADLLAEGRDQLIQIGALLRSAYVLQTPEGPHAPAAPSPSEERRSHRAGGDWDGLSQSGRGSADTKDQPQKTTETTPLNPPGGSPSPASDSPLACLSVEGLSPFPDPFLFTDEELSDQQSWATYLRSTDTERTTASGTFLLQAFTAPWARGRPLAETEDAAFEKEARRAIPISLAVHVQEHLRDSLIVHWERAELASMLREAVESPGFRDLQTRHAPLYERIRAVLGLSSLPELLAGPWPDRLFDCLMTAACNDRVDEIPMPMRPASVPVRVDGGRETRSEPEKQSALPDTQGDESRGMHRTIKTATKELRTDATSHIARVSPSPSLSRLSSSAAASPSSGSEAVSPSSSEGVASLRSGLSPSSASERLLDSTSEASPSFFEEIVSAVEAEEAFLHSWRGGLLSWMAIQKFFRVLARSLQQATAAPASAALAAFRQRLASSPSTRMHAVTLSATQRKGSEEEKKGEAETTQRAEQRECEGTMTEKARRTLEAFNAGLHALKRQQEEDRTSRFFVYATHDTTLAAILGALGVDDLRWPPYAATFLLEVYTHLTEESEAGEASEGAKVVPDAMPEKSRKNGRQRTRRQSSEGNRVVRVIWNGQSVTHAVRGCAEASAAASLPRDLCPLSALLDALLVPPVAAEHLATAENEAALREGRDVNGSRRSEGARRDEATPHSSSADAGEGRQALGGREQTKEDEKEKPTREEKKPAQRPKTKKEQRRKKEQNSHVNTKAQEKKAQEERGESRARGGEKRTHVEGSRGSSGQASSFDASRFDGFTSELR
ncbi:histidine acid phosphatase superfamily protein [Toxoplasma gondii ME49]|uniref:Histidine acid phosphatase superfamily protein n=1 Tax=Toxoplasma gondii (strain ATCC 50611 / Me49) TaxID=508771 RepID=S8F8Z3_TOXGM|nr:histidine acid phosphatase superfamily protein [Toxoplasma gondii ME49]EPT30058.1 histidine acid phosphatase superfamily protein [Toxoplasma gondii ME49]|eukprot:XP_018637322.1 histidine acid phosphatase superfamily protein [Toxoplasma gondii ME49]